MKKFFLGFIVLINWSAAFEQSTRLKLKKSFNEFEYDRQLHTALISFYVMDAVSGKVIFDYNSMVGMAPASTQKTITGAAAYEMLGSSFQYETQAGYTGKIRGHVLAGPLIIRASGDPSFGSPRWKETSAENIFNGFLNNLTNAGIKTYKSFAIDTSGWGEETIPDGWIWQDIGNYYGAAAGQLNWRENQYDLVLKSGKTAGDPVTILETKPFLKEVSFNNKATSAPAGTGDNSYIYLPIHSTVASLKGTIPVNENHFTISGAFPSPYFQFIAELEDSLAKHGIENKEAEKITMDAAYKKINNDDFTVLFQENSPPMDSLIYWYFKKSINLYGEAFIKTIAFRQGKPATTENGIESVKDFWKKKGIDGTELNLADGSGLSPLNRVTTHAEVLVLKYARSREWFRGYYNALPVYNGMKMKSGTINGVKGFCGYQKSGDGKEYIFSFLVNNYNGDASALVLKMYKVLDSLK